MTVCLEDYFDEDVTYEALITSFSSDGEVHTKPFGVRFRDNEVFLNLFPSRTLVNIVANKKFYLSFTRDSLLYARALFDCLCVDDYDENILRDASFVLSCDVVSISEEFVEDDYGKIRLSKIISKATKILKEKREVATINRATNHIIEVLIDYSRYAFMNASERKSFYKKMDSCEEIIKKTGNTKHEEALKLLKKELNKE